jgi:ankyrin repeat protein
MDLSEVIRSDDCARLEAFLADLEDVAEFSKVKCESYSLIHLVSLLGKAEFVNVMGSKGMDVNMANARGYTGLHLAGAWGHLETLKALISNGANPSLVNVRNETPCNVAERYGNQDCVKFLQAAEVAAAYKAVITGAREILGDAERISGKWNKDDKNKVTALCKEKWDWLTAHPDASVEEIESQQEEFHSRFSPYMSKLQPS